MEMNWEKTEYYIVKAFYWFFILISAVLIAEGIVRWQTHNPELFNETVQVSLFINLIFCLYLPLLGLWCLHKNYSAGYIVLGLLIVYAGLWLRGAWMYNAFAYGVYPETTVMQYNLYLFHSFF